ncbi:unnamed protein product [Penicillium olsonii]|nr:unnamed protein product [Penicillium olsonii]
MFDIDLLLRSRLQNPKSPISCPVDIHLSCNASPGEGFGGYSLPKQIPNPSPWPGCLSLAEYEFFDTIQLMSLPADDMSFLESEGCFSLPPRHLLDEFIRQYFARVHPLVPVIDEADFWRLYRTVASHNHTVSLFVLQSMLFASSIFISSATLKQCGFSNRKDARRKLYNRAKLLYELGAEPNCHAKSQGAVLLTHYTSADDPCCGSLWVSRAIKNAIRIDNQQCSLPITNLISMKKRLWWSILLRDRSLCIGLRRRPQVTSVTSHGWCGWLTTEDFVDEMHHSEVYSFENKVQLIVALEQQCELAVLVTDLTSLVFTHPRASRHPTSMADFGKITSQIKYIKESLRNWQSPPLAMDTLTSECHDAFSTLNHLTHMYYQ